MIDENIGLYPEDCGTDNVGLSTLIFEAKQKLPSASLYKQNEIRIPIQKPIELKPDILNLNLELINSELPFDSMASCWILRFRKSVDGKSWLFVELEN